MVLFPFAALAQNYQCQMKVYRYTTPQINGYQFFYRSEKPRLKCSYVTKNGNKKLKETGVFPDGKCFKRLKADPKMSNFLDNLKNNFQSDPGPFGFNLQSLLSPSTIPSFGLTFKTSESKSVVGIALKANERSYPANGNFLISNKTPSVRLIKGRLHNGIKAKLRLRKNKDSKLYIYTGFGRVSAKGLCR